MKRFNVFNLIILTVLCALFTACASLGVPPPTTFNGRVAAAQISVTAVRSTALQLLNQGAIGAADAKNARAAADTGNAAIDLAQSMYVQACPAPPAAAASAPDATAPPCVSSAADAKLQSAIAILTAMQSYLNAKGVKP